MVLKHAMRSWQLPVAAALRPSPLRCLESYSHQPALMVKRRRILTPSIHPPRGATIPHRKHTTALVSSRDVQKCWCCSSLELTLYPQHVLKLKPLLLCLLKDNSVSKGPPFYIAIICPAPFIVMFRDQLSPLSLMLVALRCFETKLASERRRCCICCCHIAARNLFMAW